jgi:hypothetical protein
MFVIVLSAFVKCMQGPAADESGSAGDAVGGDEVELETSPEPAGSATKADGMHTDSDEEVRIHDDELELPLDGVELRDEETK